MLLLIFPDLFLYYCFFVIELSKASDDLKEVQRALASLARTYFVQAEILSQSEERQKYLKEAEDYNVKSLLACERYVY